MKIKYLKNGILQKEEVLQGGWVARVSFKNSDIVNIDLSDFTSVCEEIIEIETNSFLKLIINDAHFLRSIYDIMDLYKGMEIVEFEYKETQIIVEW